MIVWRVVRDNGTPNGRAGKEKMALVPMVVEQTSRVERDVERDFIMNAQQSKEYGIIDEIIDRPRT